jgi:hypothetical protein
MTTDTFNLGKKSHWVRSKVIATALGVSMALGGFAAAAWLTSGSGDAYSKGATLTELSTVDVSASLAGDLYPGGNGTVAVRIHSDNTVPLVVTDIVGAGAATPANCQVTFTDQHGLSIAVPAGGNSAITTFDNAAHMGNGADNSCQGAVIQIPVSISATTG